MGALFAFAKALFGKLPWCSLAGGIAGIITGFIFSLFQVQNPTLVLTLQELLLIAVVLGLVAWLFLLLVIGVWLKYGVGAIALQTFVTALLAAIATVYLNNIIKLPYLAVILGWLVGILIGYLLCLFCRRYSPDLRG
jgi:acid phosphatase family membrane protein YuiD